jgi:hypothetical protein
VVYENKEGFCCSSRRLIGHQDISSTGFDLSPYRAVPSMPPIRRDISVMVPAETDDEAIGDQIRVALGPDADAVEAVEIRGRTAYAVLPRAARDRMGLTWPRTNRAPTLLSGTSTT